MSDSFRQTISALRREVLSERNILLFVDAQHRHEALVLHSTVASVLGALGDERRVGYDEKEALTRALIAELQESQTSFWPAVLLLAYYPMLSRLRHRIYGDSVSRCELDQIVIVTFLSVVSEFPLDEKRDRVALRLRQWTQRRIFRSLREDQRRQAVMLQADYDEPDRAEAIEWPATTPSGHQGPRNPMDAAAAVSLLVEEGGDVLDGECFELVTATSICGRRMPEYLERIAPDLDPNDRSREYQRIKRRHSRAMARLRPALEYLRCPRESRDLLCQ